MSENDIPAFERFPLHFQMLVGFAIGLVGGLLVNLTAGDAAWVKTLTTSVTGPTGQVFLRLLFMLVIPLLFSALVTGVRGWATSRRSSGWVSAPCCSR